MIIKALMGSWMLAFMVFHANKLNSPTNPTSRFHSYHPRNRNDGRIRDSEVTKHRGVQVLTWAELGPYIEVSKTTLGAWLVFRILKGLFWILQIA